MLVTGYAMMNKIGFIALSIGEPRQESQGEILYSLSRMVGGFIRSAEKILSYELNSLGSDWVKRVVETQILE